MPVTPKDQEILPKHYACVTVSRSGSLPFDLPIGAVLVGVRLLLLLLLMKRGVSLVDCRVKIGGGREEVLSLFHRSEVVVETLVSVLDDKRVHHRNGSGACQLDSSCCSYCSLVSTLTISSITYLKTQILL